MFGFDSVLRDEYDVVKDIKNMNKICEEWQNYKNMMPAILKQCNISKVEVCPNHKLTEYNKLVNCEKCKGTGYVVYFNGGSTDEN